MTQLEQFTQQMKKGNITIKKVDSKWPYNYDAGFNAFIAENENLKMYFCFTSEGKLIDKSTLKA